MGEKDYLAQSFDLLDNIKDFDAGGNGVSLEEIGKSEKRLGFLLPDEYKKFILQYGCVVKGDFAVFGLGTPRYLLPNIESAFFLAHSYCFDDPPSILLPFYMIKKGVFACLNCSPETKSSQVIFWDTSKPCADQNIFELAETFGEYLFRVTSEFNYRRISFSTLEKHIKEFAAAHKYSHADGGKLPSNHEWRPYRFCIQDVLFGATVVKHHREGNCLQVDVFLTANIPEYEHLAGSRALTAFLLSEAYKCGGSMELRFTNNVEGGQIPEELCELAQEYGINFAQKNRISPAESKNLFAALTGFSPQLQTHLQGLEKDGKLKMARACYVVNHGVWSKEQLEMIVLGSENPESILSGQSSPEQRHLYHHDLLHARSALLAGMFERIILQRERQDDDGVSFDMEDDFRKLEISFDGQAYLKLYKCSETVDVPWFYGTDVKQSISENVPFQVAIRARGVADLLFHAAADIQIASKIKAEKNFPTFVLFPRDFSDMPRERIAQLQNLASQSGIGILVSPEAVSTLDVDASQRLATSRVLRQ